MESRRRHNEKRTKDLARTQAALEIMDSHTILGLFSGSAEPPREQAPSRTP